MNVRSEQLAARIQQELSDIIRLKVRDPRVGFVTITRVRVSKDLGVAWAHVSALSSTGGSDDTDKSLEALKNAVGFLRTELGKRIRMRHVPELRFEEDSSIEQGIEMTRFLDNLEVPEAPTNAEDDASEKDESDGT
jgi:ribosome-binding factor A